MGGIGQTIVPGAEMTLGYADKLLEGITPERFARKPEGVDCNSPAWVYGHLALYPDRVLEAMERDDLAQETPGGWTDLFGYQSTCQDDPGGSVYPPMGELVEVFRRRHQALVGALAEADDTVLSKPNPNEKMRDRLPTVGAAAMFMTTAHVMVHLGQVSTWRRCMGLGPA